MAKRKVELKMPLLISKVQWMMNYGGETEVYTPWGDWVGRRRQPPGERFNFQIHEDGNYCAHIPLNGNLNLKRLGAGNVDRVEGVTVVFVAPWPGRDRDGLAVVGYYKDATVYSQPQRVGGSKYRGLQFRASTSNATLIESRMRQFSYSYRSKSSTFCYGDVDRYKDDNELNLYIASKMQDTQDGIQTIIINGVDVEIVGLSAEEGRKLATSLQTVRVASMDLRKLKIESDDDLVCEACCLRHESKDHEYARARFEVHHKAPIGRLEADAERRVTADDLSVLCANCHRTIHADREMKFVSDIAAFREEILRLRKK